MLELAEDSRLRDLGIDPNGDSLDIMIQLEELCASLLTKNRSGARKPEF